MGAGVDGGRGYEGGRCGVMGGGGGYLMNADEQAGGSSKVVSSRSKGSGPCHPIKTTRPFQVPRCDETTIKKHPPTSATKGDN